MSEEMSKEQKAGIAITAIAIIAGAFAAFKNRARIGGIYRRGRARFGGFRMRMRNRYGAYKARRRSRR